MPTNSECRKTASLVHSTNDTSITTLGFTQRSFVMSSAVTPSPQWPVLLLGRLTNGQREIWSAESLAKSSERLCSVSPARTLPANINFLRSKYPTTRDSQFDAFGLKPPMT